MRTLFRVFDKRNQEYVEDIENYLLFSTGQLAYYPSLELIDNLKQDNYVVERGTGSTCCKTDDELFEGDIVQQDDGQYYGVVYWDDEDGGGWYVRKSKAFDCTVHDYFELMVGCQFKIGNVRENTDLMEGK